MLLVDYGCLQKICLGIYLFSFYPFGVTLIVLSAPDLCSDAENKQRAMIGDTAVHTQELEDNICGQTKQQIT